jgi:DNA-3-methyladenine glycosylase
LRPLDRDFYLRGAVAVAGDLIGKILAHTADGVTTTGLIVETEAYAGREDAACHSYRRRAPTAGHRTAVMFGPGGYAYVYLIYGMYNCFNAVTGVENEPEAVLVRALEPREGISAMRERRGTRELKKLCSGPGRLCMAMGIDRRLYGADLCGGDLFIAEGESIPKSRISATPRINVDYAGKAARLPYRFIVKDSAFLSVKWTPERD